MGVIPVFEGTLMYVVSVLFKGEAKNSSIEMTSNETTQF